MGAGTLGPKHRLSLTNICQCSLVPSTWRQKGRPGVWCYQVMGKKPVTRGPFSSARATTGENVSSWSLMFSWMSACWLEGRLASPLQPAWKLCCVVATSWLLFPYCLCMLENLFFLWCFCWLHQTLRGLKGHLPFEKKPCPILELFAWTFFPDLPLWLGWGNRMISHKVPNNYFSPPKFQEML